MDFNVVFFRITGQNDSQATIIIGETTDAAHPTNERNESNGVATISTRDVAVAGTSDSHTNNPIDGKKCPSNCSNKSVNH